MSSQVKQAKRYIDKDALIAQTKSSIEWRKRGSVKKGEEWKSSLDEVIQTAICEGIAKIIELIESAPVVTKRDSLDDVLERLPNEYIMEIKPRAYYSDTVGGIVSMRYAFLKNGKIVSWGETPLESALKLEALLNYKTKE